MKISGLSVPTTLRPLRHPVLNPLLGAHLQQVVVVLVFELMDLFGQVLVVLDQAGNLQLPFGAGARSESSFRGSLKIFASRRVTASIQSGLAPCR